MDGILLNGNDKLITGGAFGDVVVGGAVSGDSRIIAETLPEFVVVGGKKTVTAGDQRFSL
jgi:hypothetical protein